MVVIDEAPHSVLRVKTDQKPFLGLFAAPWDVTEMAVQFRLPAENYHEIAFVVGSVDQDNSWLVTFNPNAETLRSSHVVDGIEENLGEAHVVIPAVSGCRLKLR